MTEVMPFPNMEFRFPCRITTEFAPPRSYVVAVATPATPPPDDELTLPPIVIHGIHDSDDGDPHDGKLLLPSKWRSGKVLFLRQLCQERGLLADGTKPELVARLENYRGGGGVFNISPTVPQNSSSVSGGNTATPIINE